VREVFGRGPRENVPGGRKEGIAERPTDLAALDIPALYARFGVTEDVARHIGCTQRELRDHVISTPGLEGLVWYARAEWAKGPFRRLP